MNYLLTKGFVQLSIWLMSTLRLAIKKKLMLETCVLKYLNQFHPICQEHNI